MGPHGLVFKGRVLPRASQRGGSRAKPLPMKSLILILGGLLLLGCSRSGVVKVAEGHYRTTCTSTGNLDSEMTAYAQCQKKAEEVCGGPYDLKRLRTQLVRQGQNRRNWQERAQYDIFCRGAGAAVAAATEPPAAPATGSAPLPESVAPIPEPPEPTLAAPEDE